MATGTYDKISHKRILLVKSIKRTLTSKYHNVSYDKTRNRWTAVIIHNKQRYGSKRFKTEDEAALHVNKIIDEYGFTDRPKNIVD